MHFTSVKSLMSFLNRYSKNEPNFQRYINFIACFKISYDKDSTLFHLRFNRYIVGREIYVDDFILFLFIAQLQNFASNGIYSDLIKTLDEN